MVDTKVSTIIFVSKKKTTILIEVLGAFAEQEEIKNAKER
jgi:hypothetical protein